MTGFIVSNAIIVRGTLQPAFDEPASVAKEAERLWAHICLDCYLLYWEKNLNIAGTFDKFLFQSIDIFLPQPGKTTAVASLV
jgi:hypothetical protein